MSDSTTQAMLEAYRSKGLQLAEQKWSRLPGNAIRGYEKAKEVDFLEGIEDPNKRAMMAQLTRTHFTG